MLRRIDLNMVILYLKIKVTYLSEICAPAHWKIYASINAVGFTTGRETD